MESLSSLFSLNPPLNVSSSFPQSSMSTRSLPLASTISPQRKTLRTSPKPLKPSSSPAQKLPIPNTLQNTSAPTKKVLVPIGFGTEEMEAVVLIDVLRRAGAHVTVASVEPQLQIKASGGVRLVADTHISKCFAEIFDLVALPGGMPGSVRLRDCEILRKIMSKQAEEKRLYGAICAAPAVTLLPWGLLKRKQTTCHPAFFDKLPTFWAVKTNLQVSGELTTSRGPGTSFQFALSLAEQLFGDSVAKDVAELLLMHNSNDNTKNEEFNKVEWSIDNMPHVLIPIANGCEEIEVVTIVDILRRAKIDVVVASVEQSLQISASQGTKIVADKLIAEAFHGLYDLIILPGGVLGAKQLQKSRILKRMLKEQYTAGRMYGAMCSSLAVLDGQGLLKDKRATMLPSTIYGSGNGVVTDAGVVIDGKVITSRGLASVTDFALAIISKLFGYGRARSVAEGLVFEYPRN